MQGFLTPWLADVAPALMALGAVATPVTGPIGAGVLAIGLGLVALRALRERATGGERHTRQRLEMPSGAQM